MYYNNKVKKGRLDRLLVERGLCESRNLAQRLVMAGEVTVNSAQANKPSDLVLPDSRIEIKIAPRYVSRGGEKLEAALQAFKMEKISGWICADVGSSTGGFTDCLLQHGAERVYAIDVGKGELHWKLRNNPSVIVMEKTNARMVEKLPEDIDMATIDASFISLKILIPVVIGWFGQKEVRIIALIKPQFEAGRKEAMAGRGVIREPSVHRQVLSDVIESASKQKLLVHGLIASPLTGPKGNREFLINLGNKGASINNMKGLLDAVVQASK